MSFEDKVIDIGKSIIETPIKKIVAARKAKKDCKLAIESFSPDFVKDKPEVTTLVDYYKFHENPSNWTGGVGHLHSVSYGEILRLWSRNDLISVYEAFLVRYRLHNGIITRIFVIDASHLLTSSLEILLRVLWRHRILGFNVYVCSVLDLKDVSKQLYVDCDMFANINNRVAYYVRFPKDEYPLVLRTENSRFVQTADSCFCELLAKSEELEAWLKLKNYEISKDGLEEVEHRCGVIEEIARFRSNEA